MNLNVATNEQLDEYREKTASVLKIDPFMLDYIWMVDSETGLKNRVLYAKRGAAEVLRQNLGINILSMEPRESSGWLMFTAVGKDAKGRQEIAHGAAYVESQKADKKAHAVMTASTRALRRLTLQFVAGGILDETEVQAQSALLTTPAVSEATLAGSPTVLPPPQAAPSVEPGRDVTKVETLSEKIERIGTELGYAMVDQKANITQVYAEGAEALENMKTPTVEEPKKRTYRRRNQVDIASPGQVSVPPATAKEPEQGASGNGTLSAPALAETPPVKKEKTFTGIDPLPQKVLTGVVVPLQVDSVAPILADSAPVISKEKQEEYRVRLSKYYNDILPKGGMQSSLNVGGPTMKTRKFAHTYAGVSSTKEMTEEHWEDLFEFLDSNANNPKFLVDYIDKALGVA